MHHTGYVVWVNDEVYWHRRFRAAQARVVLAQFSGKDTLLRALAPPQSVWWPAGPSGRRAA